MNMSSRRTTSGIWQNRYGSSSRMLDDSQEVDVRELKSPEQLAKEVTDPIIESFKKDLEKVDLSALKK